MPFINGLLFGFTLMVMIGPIFFALMQTSISKGFNKAILVAVGVCLGDIVFILLTYFGLSQFIGFENNKELVGYIGAAILFVFGIGSIIKTSEKTLPMEDMSQVKGFFRFIFKGIAINAFSPFVPIFWVGTMSLAKVEYGYTGLDLVIFFVTILSVVFLTDVAKAFLAHRLSRLITPRVMRIMNIVVGVVLILFAVRMATYF